MKSTLLLIVSIAVSFSTPKFAEAQWVTLGPSGYGAYDLCVAVSGTNLYAGTHDSGVYRSTDNGASWAAMNNGLTSMTIYSFAVSDTNLFVGTQGGAFRSTDSGTNWSALKVGSPKVYIITFAVSGSNLFAGTDGGVFLSTDNGTSWREVSTGLPSGIYVRALAVIGTSLFAGSDGDGVYRSTNNAASWEAVNTGLTNVYLLSLAVIGTNLFAGTLAGHVFHSTNNGSSWTACRNLPNFAEVQAIVVSGTKLFAVGGDVFLSIDSGATWAIESDLYSSANSLAVSGTDLYAATYSNGVYRRPLSEMSAVNKELPMTFILEHNFPNPFNPSTTIPFSLSKRSFVTMTVVNALGNVVAVPLAAIADAGMHSVKWDAGGSPSGLYEYRLSADGVVKVGKMVLVK